MKEMTSNICILGGGPAGYVTCEKMILTTGGRGKRKHGNEHQRGLCREAVWEACADAIGRPIHKI